MSSPHAADANSQISPVANQDAGQQQQQQQQQTVSIPQSQQQLAAGQASQSSQQGGLAVAVPQAVGMPPPASLPQQLLPPASGGLGRQLPPGGMSASMLGGGTPIGLEHQPSGLTEDSDASPAPSGAAVAGAPISAPSQQAQTYPPAEATQEQVVANSQRFYNTLMRLHAQLGITDKVPRVGGRELDLHMLYCNVTALGGAMRVTNRKQWRDAAESFNYPSTITSVSFALRNSYLRFLWDYEQVYFFRNTGPRVPAPLAQPQQREPHADAVQQPKPKKRKQEQVDALPAAMPPLPTGAPTQLVAAASGPGFADPMAVGSRGSVTLDARFDAGYFCTVRVGRNEFRGMLYFPPPHHAAHQGSLVSLPPVTLAPAANVATGQLLSPATPGPPRKKVQPRDANAPKPNKTPFNFFSVDARVKAKNEFPSLSQVDITKKVGEMWQRASAAEKAPYIAMSNNDKARYIAEMEAHRLRQSAQQKLLEAGQASNAVTAAASSHSMQMGYVAATSGSQQQQLPNGTPGGYAAALTSPQAQQQQQQQQQQQPRFLPLPPQLQPHVPHQSTLQSVPVPQQQQQQQPQQQRIMALPPQLMPPSHVAPQQPQQQQPPVPQQQSISQPQLPQQHIQIPPPASQSASPEYQALPQ